MTSELRNMSRTKSMTVLELARAVVAETQDDPEGSQLTVAAVLRLLDVYGVRNAHLQNPLNHPVAATLDHERSHFRVLKQCMEPF